MLYGKNDQIALVTGATGFIGSYVARRLVADGWKVHIIARTDSTLNQIQSILDRVSIHLHDGSTDGMLMIIKGVKPSVVFHLASFASVHYESKDIVPMIQSNVIFGTQLVEAMIANGVYHLINAGTYSQHYENKVYCPTCLYAATKQAYEDILIYYTEGTPLKVITLKMFDSYGPADSRNKIMTLLQKASNDKKSLSMSPGDQLIDIVYIDDIVNAFIIAAKRVQEEKDVKNEVYAVSSGNPIRLKDIVKVYEKVTGHKLSIEWGGRPYRPREAMIPWNNGTTLPDWQPHVSLEEGIRKLLDLKDGDV